MKTKTCCICNKNLPLSLFNKDKTRSDGHSNTCRQCKHLQQHQWYRKNRKKVKEKERNKRIYRKKHGLCKDCGKDIKMSPYIRCEKCINKERKRNREYRTGIDNREIEEELRKIKCELEGR